MVPINTRELYERPIFFGIKEVEFPIFEKVKEKYKDLKLTAVTEVISKEHIHLVDGMDCVVVRENDVVNREILELLKANRNQLCIHLEQPGFDHFMDLAAGHELGIKSGSLCHHTHQQL
nr:hypothetical protein [Mycoplasmopsis bovis]